VCFSSTGNACDGSSPPGWKSHRSSRASSASLPVAQERIANFLDDKTARIDPLIAEKERLLSALVEWWPAELTRICFGEEVATMPTSNLWIPKVPTGWRIARLKHFVSGIEQGWSPECEAGLAANPAWGVLKAEAANAGDRNVLPVACQPLMR